jgi:PAS domain S-box-containing protein
VNHAAARLLARPRGKLTGTRFADLLTIDDRRVYNALIGRAMDSNEREEAEVEVWPIDGRRAFLRLTATLLERGDGNKVLLGVQDITQRRERDQKLQLTEDALREADRRKDDFLAMLSHELRNPLAPIRNALYVLARAEAGGSQAQRAQQIIDRQVNHLTRLVDDLLDVTRIARGKIHLRKERIDLGDLVRRTVDDHRASFDAADVKLETRIVGGHFWLDADPARLVQSLSNVLVNALKFTPGGGIVTVTLDRSDSGRAILKVRDSGAGISRDVLPHLFVPFAQGPQSMDRSRGGLGLGLAMVRGLVELHGGSVEIASEGLDRGSVLTIHLPLESEAPTTAPEPRPPEHAHGRRVLVIEDNMDAADTLKEALAVNGHDVAVAYDGITGLARARAFQPEIVICDVGLPGMDGYAVARAFRAMGERAPYLIALSGYAQPEDLERAKDAGFDRHVAKPPSLDTLDRLLSEAPLKHGTETAPSLLH